jgi:hypothetical protein
MTGLPGRQIVVHEVDVADERAIPQRCSIWRSRTASNARAATARAQLVDLCANSSEWTAPQRADGATQRVQNMELQPVEGAVCHFS